jgi:DNA polymerase
MTEPSHEALAEKLGELIDALSALRDLGRRLTVQEERLVALAKAQPRLRPAAAGAAATGRPTKAAAKPKETTPPATDTPRPRGNPLVPTRASLQEVRDEMGDCKRCDLWQSRTKLVFGDGSPRAELMFVGEGPGADEDAQGLPFVGRAGQLLNKMIAAMGKRREDVYIGNIVKSRPPENRAPHPDEVAACLPFLLKQIQVIRPRVIVCLGSVALQNLLGNKLAISRVRGQWQLYHDIRVMPTYHPAYLLRNADAKKPVWEDLQLVMAELGWPMPKKRG